MFSSGKKDVAFGVIWQVLVPKPVLCPRCITDFSVAPSHRRRTAGRTIVCLKQTNTRSLLGLAAWHLLPCAAKARVSSRCFVSSPKLHKCKVEQLIPEGPGGPAAARSELCGLLASAGCACCVEDKAEAPVSVLLERQMRFCPVGQ